MFKPLQQFRYLRGQVNDTVNRVDLKNYNKHRYNVRPKWSLKYRSMIYVDSFYWQIFCATSRVDSKPLKLNPYKIFNVTRLRCDLIRSEQIDRENKELLKKINKINRQGVSSVHIVDIFNLHYLIIFYKLFLTKSKPQVLLGTYMAGTKNWLLNS